MGVPGLNIKIIDGVGSSDKKEEGSESSLRQRFISLAGDAKAQPHPQIGTQGAEFVASPDSSCQTHLIAA